MKTLKFTRRKKFAPLFFILLAIVLVSCAGSQVPLSLPGDVSVDRQLIGIWVETDSVLESKTDKMTIYQFNDYEYLIEFLPKGTIETDLLRLRAYTTTISNILFANVQCIECDDDNDYTFFRYELTKQDILEIRPVKTKLYEDPLFTTSHELLDFIRKNMGDKEIYEEVSYFRRAK